jgi:hypothetical protein
MHLQAPGPIALPVLRHAAKKSATGGDVYAGTSTKSIEAAFNRIVEQARYQYVLGYVSNNPAEAATFRTITVTTYFDVGLETATQLKGQANRDQWTGSG